jgi:CheY-like chemotaxis protein
MRAIQYMLGVGEFADRVKYPYPTFIITDLRMPGADGFAVLEHLKHNPDRAVVPAVVLTASADPDDVRKAYLLGASSYHVKPCTHQALCLQLKLLHDYWMTSETPEVDANGRHLPTESTGKLGERYQKVSGCTEGI